MQCDQYRGFQIDYQKCNKVIKNVTRNVQTNQKYQNNWDYSEIDSKSKVPRQKIKDRNMKAGNNVRSQTLTTDHKRIAKGVKRMFLG